MSLTENFLDVGPSSVASTGHQTGSIPRTLFTARYTRTDKEQALGLELFSPSNRIGVVGVSTVNDDVTLLEVGLELGDKVVYGLTGFDEEDDSARGFELLAQFLNRVGADDVGA